MSSHNKGHRNYLISFLSKEPITAWILYATQNQPTQVLIYGTNSLDLGELLLTAIPKQLTKDPIFWFRNRSCNQGKQSVTFFLELNNDTLTIWYQIDQCHLVYTAESLVPYLKLHVRSFDSNKHVLNQLPNAT